MTLGAVGNSMPQRLMSLFDLLEEEIQGWAATEIFETVLDE